MSSYRAREPRVPVKIRARVKSDHGWGDSQVCNVSAGGMMVRYAPPPPLGSYVEVCRGRFSVVGRVRWIAVDRFGLQALERIDLDQLRNPEAISVSRDGDRRLRPRKPSATAPRAPDLAERLAASQRVARQFQFLVTIALGVALALALAGLAASALATPLDRVGTILVKNAR